MYEKLCDLLDVLRDGWGATCKAEYLNGYWTICVMYIGFDALADSDSVTVAGNCRMYRYPVTHELLNRKDAVDIANDIMTEVLA